MDTVVNEVVNECKGGMEKVLAQYLEALQGIRTGRPHRSLLENVPVKLYGETSARMQSVARVEVSGSNLFIVTPFDPSTANAVAKAIEEADLNLLPRVQGKVIHVPVPPMSEERRKGLVQEARKRGEHTKVAIREVRKKANEQLKKQKGGGDIGEDEVKRGEKLIQEFTDKYCEKVATLLATKEKEILTV